MNWFLLLKKKFLIYLQKFTKSSLRSRRPRRRMTTTSPRRARTLAASTSTRTRRMVPTCIKGVAAEWSNAIGFAAGNRSTTRDLHFVVAIDFFNFCRCGICVRVAWNNFVCDDSLRYCADRLLLFAHRIPSSSPVVGVPYMCSWSARICRTLLSDLRRNMKTCI